LLRLGIIAITKGLVTAIVLPITIIGFFLDGYAGFGGSPPDKTLKEIKHAWKDKRAKDDVSPIPGLIVILGGIALILLYFFK